MDRNNIYAEIFDEYSRDKKTAERNAEKLKTALYKSVPRLGEIEAEIKKMSVGIFRSTVGSGDLNKIEEFKIKCNKLTEERQNILKSLGMDESSLEPQYKCLKCRDTGMIDVKRCDCFNRRLTEKYYQLSNLGDILKKENFDNFNCELFSKEICEDNLSPYSNIKKISRSAIIAIENIENEPVNMLFYGNSGLGKSYMCNCIAKELIDRGYFVIYMSAYKLFTMMTNVRFKNASKADEEAADLLEKCDLLVIDDLGTEGVNSSTVPEFFDILNTRLRAGKSIIISTNLDLPNLGVVYTERILSRIIGSFKIYKFIGGDLRHINKN